MPQLRISEAAALLGVSDDTVRRWADSGRLPVTRGAGGRLVVEGRDLAELAAGLADAPESGVVGAQSARNRLRGIVTRVQREGLIAQVDLQAGPFRIVSLMTREAADELCLEPGVIAIAAIKSTSVLLEVPA